MTIRPDFKGFGPEVKRQLSSVNAGFTETTKKAGGLSNAFGGVSSGAETMGAKVGSAASKMGAALVAATAVGGVALAGFSLNIVRMASDAGENLNKVKVVFGDASKGVENFAKNAAEWLGLSRSAALGALGTFGNLFTAMGIGAPRAAALSQGILKLAADLASFNNIKPEEALEKLRAGLVGETEPLRSLGVNLNAASIEAKALALGLVPVTRNSLEMREASLKLTEAQKNLVEVVKEHGAQSLEHQRARINVAKAEEAVAAAMKGSTGELTAAAKAQAAFALIQEQTISAQGDFARTSDGLANSMRKLKAHISDAQVSLGNELLPTVERLVGVLVKDGIPLVTEMARLFQLGFKGGSIGGDIEGVRLAAFNLGQTLRNDIIPALIAIKDTLVKDFWPAFKLGLDTIMPVLAAFFLFIIDHKVALVLAITAIGLAMAWALPGAPLIIGLGLLIIAIGQFKDNWAELAEIAKNPIKFTVDIVFPDFSPNIGKPSFSAPGLPTLPNPFEEIFNKFPKWPGKAAGGWGSGLTWVGERGPELVNLPSGSYVNSNEQSKRMGAAAADTGVVVNAYNTQVHNYDKKYDANRVLGDLGFAIADEARRRGIRR